MCSSSVSIVGPDEIAFQFFLSKLKEIGTWHFNILIRRF